MHPKLSVLLTVLAVGLLAVPRPLSAQATDRPNVIFIISDDQAWGDYSFMGHPHIRTPHLDRLSRQSRLFRNGYVTTSLCSPSLATIISGLYPSQHLVTGNEPPAPVDENGRPLRSHPDFLNGRTTMDEIFRESPTLPKILRRYGYRSFQTGKWWHGSYELPGFDDGMTHGDPARGGRHGDEGLTIGRTGLQPIYDFIEKDKNKPFFLWYAPFLPHTPHTPPRRLLEKYADSAPSLPVAKYWAMCEWFDETCGELLKYLDDNSLRENTLVLYVTDNGWINQLDASRYAPKSKRSPYDGGLRTPIMVHWKGRIPPTEVPHLASSIDLVPTVLEMLDIPVPARLQGLNLLDDQALSGRTTIHGAIYLHDANDIHVPVRNLTHWWARNDQWKIIIPNPATSTDGTVELYNLHTDPHETRNLFSAETMPLVSQLTASTLQWWGLTHLH